MKDSSFNRWKAVILALLVCGFLGMAAARVAYAAPGSCCDTYCDETTCETEGTTEGELTIELPSFETIVNTLLDFVIDLFIDLIDTLITTLETRIMDFVIPNFSDFFSGLFQEELDPDFKSMTRQLNTAQVDQTRMDASLRDAQLQVEAQQDTAREEYNIRRKYMPNEKNCVTGTVVGGLARSRAITRAMSTALESYGINGDRKFSKRGKNHADTAAAGGPVVDFNEAWEIYKADFCDGDFNRGAAGCSTAPLANEDMRVGKNVLTPLTIDPNDADTKKILENMQRNIFEPYVPEPVPNKVVDSPIGRRNLVVVNRPVYAKRMVASYNFTDIIAQRTPGSRMGGWLGEIADAVAMPPSLISANPSEYEYMDRITFLRYATPAYYMTIGADPERERLELSAIQSIEARSYYEELEKMGMIMAVNIGDQADDFMGLHSSKILEESKQ